MKKDIYYNGKIYQGSKTNSNLASLKADNIYPVISPHNFKDGEDVTGRYELKYQVDVNAGTGNWKDINDDWYNRCEKEHRRIVANPVGIQQTEGVITGRVKYSNPSTVDVGQGGNDKLKGSDSV